MVGSKGIWERLVRREELKEGAPETGRLHAPLSSTLLFGWVVSPVPLVRGLHLLTLVAPAVPFVLDRCSALGTSAI